jgi:hypothetical protein
MGRNTSEQNVAGTLFGGGMSVQGEWHLKVYRADGSIESKVVKNIVTRMGLNHIANRALNNTTPFYVLGVGTQTAAHSLDSTQGGIGEVIRKASALSLQSREWVALQCTIGGAADSVTSVVLDTAAMFTFPTSYAITANSGGVMGNAANGLGVTLGGSDLLDLTVRIRIGSHDLSHST